MGVSQNQNMQQQQQMMNQLHQLQQQQMSEGIISNQNIGGGQKMRENLHFAADNVSSAMTSLVRELNTGAFLHKIFR